MRTSSKGNLLKAIKEKGGPNTLNELIGQGLEKYLKHVIGILQPNIAVCNSDLTHLTLQYFSYVLRDTFHQTPSFTYYYLNPFSSFHFYRNCSG